MNGFLFFGWSLVFLSLGFLAGIAFALYMDGEDDFHE